MFFTELILIFLWVFITTDLLMKWRKRKEMCAYRYPPSIPSFPLVGSLSMLFIRDVIDVSTFFMKKARELGPIFTFGFGNRLAVTLNTKDAIDKAYVKNSLSFIDRPEVYIEALCNPENKGISFLRNINDWKKQHQLALSILKEFGFGSKDTMETRIHEEVDAMKDYIIDKKGESFDPSEMCGLLTSNIIMNIVFGRRRDYRLGLSETSKLTHSLISHFNVIYDIVPLIRFLPPYPQKALETVEIARALSECIEAQTAESIRDTAHACFVQSYIQRTGPDYDRAQLNYMLRDLVAAGTDTSATTLLWGLVALANNPEVQKRSHEEIDAVVTGDRLPSLQDRANLPYVEATILEIMRWRTLSPLSLPRATSQDSIVDGYFIPGGIMVFANLYAVHNDIGVWKDPEVFRPERFLDNENNIIGKDHVIPFSVGRRSCLGETLARAELFLVFTSLLKRFLVLPPEGERKVSEDPKLPVVGLLCPGPFKIRLMERK